MWSDKALSTSIAVASLTLTVILSAGAFAQQERATTSKESGTARKPPAKTAPKKPQPVQPKLVPLPVHKCVGCASTIRRRVAVMPVKVGSLPSELNRSADALSGAMRDSVEKELAVRKSLLVVSRGDLGDVIAEQRMASSGAFDKGLRAPPGKLIPAEALLTVSVEALSVSTSREKEESSTAKQYHARALQAERGASELQSQARDKAREAERIAARGPEKTAGEGVREAISEGLAGIWLNCAKWSGTPMYDVCTNQEQMSKDSHRRQKEANREAAERRYRNQVASVREAAEKLESQAVSAMDEARNLRREADLEAEKNTREVVTTNGELRLSWKALEVTTGAVIAAGVAVETGSEQAVGEATRSAFAGNEMTVSSRADVLVNRLIAGAVSKAAAGLDDNLEKIPFRAKIVAVSARGVTINAGENRGIGVGDTFGVRQKRQVLTDPDTGELLSSLGAPIGLIRVSEVQKQTACAQVIEGAGNVCRGDELEWIGVFEVRDGGIKSTTLTTSTSTAAVDSKEIWTDLFTGLVWADRDNGGDIDWHGANLYGLGLKLGGRVDWRLPDVGELRSLFSPDRKRESQDSRLFPKLTGSSVWISETADSSSGWTLLVPHNATEWTDPGDFLDRRVLCVRPLKD